MCTGRTELRPGLKSTASLKDCCFAKRLIGLMSFNVVVLICLTFISELLLFFIFMTSEVGHSGHLRDGCCVLRERSYYRGWVVDGWRWVEIRAVWNRSAVPGKRVIGDVRTVIVPPNSCGKSLRFVDSFLTAGTKGPGGLTAAHDAPESEKNILLS